jgi:DNA-binding transcriptional ArsR family regulator
MTTATRTTAVRIAAAMKAVGHPVRLLVLAEMASTDERLSPRQLADRIDATLGTTAYHVRQLRAAGCLTAAGTAQRRGATEHYYRLSDRGRKLLASIENGVEL